MLPKRIIARLDIKGNRLIKGIHLEGWRFIGNPNEYSKKYYQQDIDEIIYIDAVASLYNRDMIIDVVEKTTKDVFVPLTVGGGIRTVDDAYKLLRAGADKVAVNTGAVKNPQLITDIATKFGKQCFVLSIDAKQIGNKQWEVYIDSSREPTGLDVMEWAEEAVNKGAGEILITSIDRDGTKKGFDIDLIKELSEKVSIPIIASGGLGKLEDFVDVIKNGKADAVAIASALHYNNINLGDLHKYANDNKIYLRNE